MLISEAINTQAVQMNTSDIIAAIAVLISLVSIIISVITMKQTTDINKTNLQAEYFQKNFFDYIVEKIPDKAKALRYSGGKLDVNYTELINVVMDMVQESKFFSYAKQDFYIELKQRCKDFEDVVLTIAAGYTDVVEEQKKNIVDINLELQKIVKLINDNYYKF